MWIFSIFYLPRHLSGNVSAGAKVTAFVSIWGLDPAECLAGWTAKEGIYPVTHRELVVAPLRGN